MAQIEQSDNGKKKKGGQKKMAIHVDFTPMVDMNMLLITFFMLCTTMMKSQTLKIALPTNEEVKQEQQNQAAESDAITMILDTELDKDGNPAVNAEGKIKNTIYYYEGAPRFDPATGQADPNQLKTAEFLGNQGDVQRGIRKVLHERNQKVVAKVEELKEKWRNNEFSSSKEENQRLYEEEAKKARGNKDLKPPIVIIKATENASWESVISALDEMQINEIAKYQIDNITEVDYKMMGKPVPESLKKPEDAAAPAK